MCWPTDKSKAKRRPVRIPENGTKLNFHSPFDDFVVNSLAAIAGLFGKLDYVAGLRRGDGIYSHWGLARVHGENAAHQAALEAHHLLFSKVLSTPLERLLDDAAQSQSASSLSVQEYLDYLGQRAPILAPQGAGEGPRLHFSSVLDAISALTDARNRTNRPAS
ncbi:MAG TPA: hypothetical protein VFU27_05315 [Terriglobales bacterium]|nr:hypothetical protein [Terriglobales bacterium]